MAKITKTVTGIGTIKTPVESVAKSEEFVNVSIKTNPAMSGLNFQISLYEEDVFSNDYIGTKEVKTSLGYASASFLVPSGDDLDGIRECYANVSHNLSGTYTVTVEVLGT